MSIPANIKFLSIEGAIGVGKTSLARMLASHFETAYADSCAVSLLEEKFDANPFLEKFYANPDEYAFQTQIFFLVSRLKELENNINQIDLFRRLIISDYTFDKDRIFALHNLTDEEFSLYETISNALEKHISPPDFIIYLEASTDTLQKRIRLRNREMEKNISREYLQDIQESYGKYFWHYSGCPVLIINTDNIDFVHNEVHFQEIVKIIETWPTQTSYFVPQGK